MSMLDVRNLYSYIKKLASGVRDPSRASTRIRPSAPWMAPSPTAPSCERFVGGAPKPVPTPRSLDIERMFVYYS